MDKNNDVSNSYGRITVYLTEFIQGKKNSEENRKRDKEESKDRGFLAVC